MNLVVKLKPLAKGRLPSLTYGIRTARTVRTVHSAIVHILVRLATCRANGYSNCTAWTNLQGLSPQPADPPRRQGIVPAGLPHHVPIQGEGVYSMDHYLLPPVGRRGKGVTTGMSIDCTCQLMRKTLQSVYEFHSLSSSPHSNSSSVVPPPPPPLKFPVFPS